VDNTIPFWSLWYFHLPNFVLAVVMYTMLGRALLGLFLDPDSKNYIWRGFCAITDPFLKVFTLVTPKATSPVVQWLFGFVWMFWLRVALLIGFFSLGILRMGGS
jgi:YggT family protein